MRLVGAVKLFDEGICVSRSLHMSCLREKLSKKIPQFWGADHEEDVKSGARWLVEFTIQSSFVQRMSVERHNSLNRF